MLGLLLVLACNAAPLAQLDLREERAALLAADSAFAVRASQALLPAFRDMLDEDVIFLDPGERTLFGKAAALAMLASDGVSAAATQAWRAVRVDVSADGGAGYTYGFGSMTGPFGPGGAARTLPAKYIAYWRKSPTGGWLVAGYARAFQHVTAPADPPAGFESPGARQHRHFPNQDPGRARRAVMDADRAFAARAVSDDVPTAFGAYAATDGAILSGQPGIIYGPDAIRSHFRANFPAKGRILWRPVAGDVAAGGDLGFTVGEAEIHTMSPDGTPRTSYSKYLTVWRRADVGEWRYVIDGGNDRPQP
jgi:ketosteroid isomerase-like protein